MKAILIRKNGPWRDVMRLEEVERPAVGPKDVLVEVHAVTANRTRDVQAAEGHYGKADALPLVPGVDPSGVVVETGDEVSGIAAGDRVVVISRPLRRLRVLQGRQRRRLPVGFDNGNPALGRLCRVHRRAG